jgi:LysM repeat protein
MVGAGAMNATEQLDDIIGDDVLFDRLQELAKEDPNANCWDDTEVQARLSQLGVSLNVDQTPDQVQSNTERDGVSENKSMEFGKQNLVPWEGGASGGFGGGSGGGGGGTFGLGGRGGSPMNIDIGLGGTGRGTILRQPEKFMGKAVQVQPPALAAPQSMTAGSRPPGPGAPGKLSNIASGAGGLVIGAGVPLAMVSSLSGGGNATPATNKAPAADKEPTAAPAADKTPAAADKTPAAAPNKTPAAPKTPSTYKGTAGAQEIAKLSGVADVNKIKVGQTLTLPGGAGSYTVQAGDTLDKIAARQAPVSSTTTSTPTSTSTPASDSMAPAPTATSPEAPSASIEKLKSFAPAVPNTAATRSSTPTTATSPEPPSTSNEKLKSFAPSIDEYESLMQKIGNRQEMMNKINQQIDDLPEGDNLNSFVEEDDDPMNYNAAITGSYYESSDPLARIKSLAFPNRTK